MRMVVEDFFFGCKAFVVLGTLPETKPTSLPFTPENRPFEKERKLVFQPSFFRCKLAGFVSGRGLVPDGVPDPYEWLEKLVFEM